MADAADAEHSAGDRAATYTALRKPMETPQQALDRHWRQFTSRRRGKPLTVLPDNDLAERVFASQPEDGIVIERATASYEGAVAKCKAKVAAIVKECRRVNQKYRDIHFDLEDYRMCLQSLTEADSSMSPKSICRVGDIFTAPSFYIGGVSANDVRQGRSGDCWFLAAVAAISNMKDLVEKNCVARDEEVGVYGFVFHRDGEWISEIIDDKLYLKKPNYNDPSDDRIVFDDAVGGLSEEKYRKAFLTGSDSLFFAQCREENETWLPLLEKAFAKAHGDYLAIKGGYTGEAIEDLTGGITSELRATDILDKQKFWQELLQCNRQFIFGCWTGAYHRGADYSLGGIATRQGIVESHAYSVLRAVEEDGERLVMLHNPWGKTEWKGAWSDGSSQWTPAWMERLDHKFGDDGAFWMSYQDLLRNFELFDRTRLFGPDWTCTQVWASFTVPWKISYHDTKFCFTLDKAGLVVVALSQLDDRYFRGLEGQYHFSLQFRLQKDDEADFVVRSPTNYCMSRSVSTELHLEAGSYTVYVKIVAHRWDEQSPIEDVVSRASKNDWEKLTQIGMKYDLAHTKREIRDTEDERKIKEKEAKRKAKEEMRKVKREKAVVKKRQQRLKAKQKKQAKREKKAKEKAEKKAAAAAAAAAPEQSKEDAVPTDDDKPERVDAVAGELTTSEEAKGAHGDVDTKPQDALPIRGPKATSEEGTEAKSQPNEVKSTAGPPAPKEEEAKPEAKSNEKEEPKPEPVPAEKKEEAKKDASDAHSDLDTDDADSEDDDDDVDEEDEEEEEEEVEEEDDKEEEGTGKESPWNAVAVVGLRVFTRAAKVKLRVVTPKDADEPGVDVDDSAADAQADAGVGNVDGN